MFPGIENVMSKSDFDFLFRDLLGQQWQYCLSNNVFILFDFSWIEKGMICLPDNVLGELVGVLLLVHVAVRHQELLQMVSEVSCVAQKKQSQPWPAFNGGGFKS